MKFKSVLGAFIVVVIGGIIGLGLYVQSNSFGNFLSKIIADLADRKIKTQIKISDLTISYFPPGIELNKVEISKDLQGEGEIQAELGKLGFYFKLFEFEEKKLSFGEISIQDSYIKVSKASSDEELEEIDQKIIKKIFEPEKFLPIDVDSVQVLNAQIIFNENSIHTKRIKISKKEKSYLLKFHLSNISNKKIRRHKLDEIWGESEIDKNRVKVFRMKLQQDVHSLILKGEIKNYRKLKSADAKFSGDIQFYLSGLKNLIKLPDGMDISDGVAQIGFNINYASKKVITTSDVYIEEFKSKFLTLKELKSYIRYENDVVILENLSFKNDKELMRLKRPEKIFNMADNTYLTQPLEIEFQNLDLNNVLGILGPGIKPLKGLLSGELTFEMKDGNLYFYPQNGLKIKNLGVVFDNAQDSFEFLMIKGAELHNSYFSVIDSEFRMKSELGLAKSKLNIEGAINSESVLFLARNAQINLEDFGNISQLGIKGHGVLDIEVSGPLDQTLINLSGKTKGFEILGYRLDETEKNISIDLQESNVLINKLESKLGKTKLSGNGSVNFKSAEIALGITAPNAQGDDLREILYPIFKDLKEIPDDLDYKANIDVDIFGRYYLPDLKLRSKVLIQDLNIYGENFDRGTFELGLENKILKFNNVEFTKAEGRIGGQFFYDIFKKSFDLGFSWESLELQDFNLTKSLGINLNTVLDGKVSGGGPLEDFNLNLNGFGSNTKSGNYTFEDSKINFSLSPKKLKGEANLLGGSCEVLLDLSNSTTDQSSAEFKLKTDRLKPILISLLGTHLENENFFGELDVEADLKFKTGFEDLNFNTNLKKLRFYHPEFKIDYFSTVPQFVIKNGNIEKWNFNLTQPDISWANRAEGKLGSNAKIFSDLKLNSKIADILSSKILSSDGIIENTFILTNYRNDFDLSVFSKTNDLSMSLEKIPVQLNNMKYDIKYNSKKVLIKNLSVNLDSGLFMIKGDLFFDKKLPDINLNYVFERAEIPILGKSNVNISGEGVILGNGFPYTVGGDISVNRAQILNELNEFSTKSAGFSQVRFLPKGQDSSIGKMFTLNLGISAETPIRITNSLMDVALVGELQLEGDPSRLRAEGRLTSPLNSSRIFFKNNEYQILSADITFSHQKEISNPDFDIKAMTTISSYKLYPKAYGDLESFNFDLTSDPALPRNSILSLIAFGYTDEIQTTLYAKDQQSLTQVGVGSFVFDRFKISDILNKQFGLQVNLGTVIEQSGTDSLLSGRTQSASQGTGGLGRTRSATKIELKKRLDEALTLSVSSTMGGTIGQRQSMNLNYGISKGVQLEGVYELRTNEEGDADIIYNSIGGDIKFRRTFK